MILKNLSRYDIEVDENDRIVVRSIRLCRRPVTPQNRPGGSTCYRLRIDSPEKKYRPFTIGYLRFLLRNPEVDPLSINQTSAGIRFDCQGNIIDWRQPGLPRRKNYTSFRDIDAAIETTLIMKAASKGDISFLYTFVRDHIADAEGVVSRLMGRPLYAFKESRDEAIDIFISQISTANVQIIIPLFSWLCKCVKIAAYKRSQLYMMKKNLRSLVDTPNK